MDDLILADGIDRPFHVQNGRQIARRSDGVWLLVYDGVDDTGGLTAYLRVSSTPDPLTEDDLSAPIPLAGNGGDSTPSVVHSGPADQISITVDTDDRLHAVWRNPADGGLLYAQCGLSGVDICTALAESGSWFGADGKTPGPERIDVPDGGRAELGDIVVSGSRIFLTYVKNDGKREKIRLAVFDGGWDRIDFPLEWDCRDPVLDVGEDGTVHLVFGPGSRYTEEIWTEKPFETLERTGLYHVQSSDGGKTWTGAAGNAGVERIGIFGDHPSVVSHSGRIWAVFHPGLKKEPGGHVFREGPTIHYSFFDGQRWYCDLLSDPVSPDLCVSPQLSLDRNGQPKLFYANLTRHHTFMCRWMGKSWSRPQESRVRDVLSPHFSVEKRMSVQAEVFGLMVGAERPEGELTFGRVEVPRIRGERGERILFLDLWELQEMRHLELAVNTAKKDPGNPVLTPGEEGEWDDNYAICYGSVLYEDGLYRMWYEGYNRTFSFGAMGYAASRDGVHWEKPVLGLKEYKGSKENNILILGREPGGQERPWGGGITTSPSLYKDMREMNPDKRYKVLVQDRLVDGKNSAILTSPDGIHWEDTFSTGLAGDMSSLFYDEREPNPDRRWKLFGHNIFHEDPALHSRHGRLFYSPDGLNWTEHPRCFLDPHGGLEGNRPIRQEELSKANDHIPSVYPYRQYYLCIYDFWHESTAIDNELAVSRDGYHFVRVGNGQKLIPLGESGEFDEKCVSKAFTLVEVEDRILIYYAGLHMVEQHPYCPLVGTGSTGLARLPADGWTYLRVRAEHTEGQVVSVPVESGERKTGPPQDLVVKADHLKEGESYILVELLDADSGESLPGFSEEECLPVEKDDRLQPVRWGDKCFRDAETDRVMVRFHLFGDDTRLYCFGFE